jgi:hypothetical protein
MGWSGGSIGSRAIRDGALGPTVLRLTRAIRSYQRNRNPTRAVNGARIADGF